MWEGAEFTPSGYAFGNSIIERTLLLLQHNEVYVDHVHKSFMVFGPA